MVSDFKTRSMRWTDRTLSILRASRLESCEKELAGLGGCGLFDAETTDVDAERLFEISWMAEEEKEPRLHTIEEMRKQVLSHFVAEYALLSPEETDLVIKLAVLGGEMPLYDWNDLIPARSLIKRLWCQVDPNRKDWILMPRWACLMTILTTASDDVKRIHEIVERIVETVDNTRYLAGAMPAETVIRDLAWQLQGTMAADQPVLYSRLLKASFETMIDQEGRLMLIHPGLADPRGFLQRPERLTISGDQQRMEEIYESLMEVEDPLYEKMLDVIQQLTRPEAGAEDTVEDLMLLAKQGAPVQEIREVLASRIICLPTAEMLSALADIHDRVPKWVSLNMARMQ